MRYLSNARVAAAVALATALTAFFFGGGATEAAREPVKDDEATSISDLPTREFHALYFHVADDFQDLAEDAVAIVRARALDSTQEPGEDPELVYTHQRFETLETYAGSVGDQFTVFLTGGVVAPDGREPYLLTDRENPQYEQGKDYFLVLAEHPSVPDELVAIGPSQGRYEIVEQKLQAIEGARNFAIEGRLHGLTVARAAQALRDARGRP